MIINLAQAIHSLAPGASWVYEDDDYSTIQWLSDDIKKPTKKAVEAEILRLTQVAADKEAAKLEAEAAQQAAKESALAKLAKLGLTQEEAKAVIGL